MAGKVNKNRNRRITTEKSYNMLLDTVITYDRHQKRTLPVPKIKSFFSKTPSKIQDIAQDASDSITNDYMEQIDIDSAKY